MTAPTRRLTRRDVRRLAIARQRLDGRPPLSLFDTIREIGCVQLDPIRYVARSHRLVLRARVGAYTEAALRRLRWEDRVLFEHWAHAASLVLTEEYPLYRYGMIANGGDRPFAERGVADNWARRFDVDPSMLVDLHAYLLGILTREGPQPSRAIKDRSADERYESRWSNGRWVTALLQHMWDAGEIGIVGRERGHRIWGLLDPWLPPDVPRGAWSADEVTPFAAQRSLRALGAATAKQIRQHYTRRRYPQLAQVMRRLVASGAVLPVEVVDGDAPLKGPWYMHAADVPLLDAIQAGEFQPRTVLLSPFDNLICDRERTEQLWDFHFRIEIYVPAAKRQYGYYVLPILHGDRLIGRVDSQFERKTGRWRVDNVYLEPDAPTDIAARDAVAAEMARLARFIGADSVAIDRVHHPAWADLAPRVAGSDRPPDPAAAG